MSNLFRRLRYAALERLLRIGVGGSLGSAKTSPHPRGAPAPYRGCHEEPGCARGNPHSSTPALCDGAYYGHTASLSGRPSTSTTRRARQLHATAAGSAVCIQAFQRPPTRCQERRIKGWSRRKKIALIEGDWDGLKRAARKDFSRDERGRSFDTRPAGATQDEENSLIPRRRHNTDTPPAGATRDGENSLIPRRRASAVSRTPRPASASCPA